mgnify:CR=1 FL=1
MMIIPALDLIDGGVVRLAQGDFTRRTDYGDDAIERALAYERAGARCLHVVDLDSAKGGGAANLALIRSMCETLTVPVQTGGGVRSAADIEARLNAGAARVVVGSVCIQSPLTFAEWLAQFGTDTLVAGLDVKQAMAAHQNQPSRWVPHASGWSEPGALDLQKLLDLLIPSGLKHVLCTDIDRDGLLQGPSVELYEHLVTRYPTLAIQASGGIGASDDLDAVSAAGVDACIVGRALLEGHVPLAAIGRFGNDDGAMN